MQHFTFGRNNGMRVSQLALGTGNFGTGWGYGTDVDSCRRILDAFADAGGTFIDTAQSYQGGEAEEAVGAVLAGRRNDFSIATKFAIGGREGSGPLHTGNGHRAMVGSVEGSLRRLGTDHVDLLWVHFPDLVTPLDEIVAAFDRLARSGKVLYAGLSNFPAWMVSRMATIAELRGTIPIAAAQFEYSLAQRDADRELFPMVETIGMGAALWGPLGGGLLTGKYRSGEAGRLQGLQTLVQTESGPQKTAVVDSVLRAAADTGLAPAVVAVAWVLARARRSTTGVVPIIGPRTPEHLTAYLSALYTELPPEVYAYLDAASQVDVGEPHGQIAERLELARGGPGSWRGGNLSTG